jgi:hypothetical protein
MKTCGNCKREMPLENFSRMKSGHQRYCKRCMSEYGAYFRKSATRNMRFRNNARGEFFTPRQLTSREVRELQEAVGRCPQQPIRLKVFA